MKFLRETETERVYTVRPSELQMLLMVLGSFPVLDRPQPLSKSESEERLAEAQKVLEDAMSEHWRGMRQELEAWLKAPNRFRQTEGVLEWRIENDRREWLLQAFNNVRVGSWRELGAPEDLDEIRNHVSGDSVHHLALMEMAGMFQMVLLGDGPA